MKSSTIFATPLILWGVVLNVQAAGENQELFTAIRNGDLKIVQKLIAGANVNARDSHGATPLMYAAQYSSSDCVKLLLDKRADANAANDFGATALMWGARDPLKVRLLLAAGANVNAQAKSGRTALMAAAGYAGAGESVRAMIDAGADVKAHDSFNSGAVIAAAESGDTAVLKMLLDKGADLNETGMTFGSALMRASALENVDAVKLLVARGANVNWKSSHNPPVKAGQQELGELTALLLAAQTGNTEIVKILLNAGADIETRDMRGMTPLLLAVTTESQNAETVRLLVRKGARVDVAGKDGRSALEWARLWGDTPIVALLLEAGAKDLAKKETASAAAPPTVARTAGAAVEKSVALLQASSMQFFQKSGCASCHHQYPTGALVTIARNRGLAVGESSAAEALKQSTVTFEPHRELMLQRSRIPGAPATTVALAASLADQNIPASPLTDALVHDIAGWQRPDGSWHYPLNRPPIESSISDTALAIRALRVYAPPARKLEFDRQVERARAWLLAASPDVMQDRVMRLMGLKWSGTDSSQLRNPAAELGKLQRSDGGWAQRAGLESDAYATGEALFALHEAAGLPASDGAYQRGVGYLLRTQLEDGSWYVKSRSVKFQPYFESGFPHGHDQWISAAGTAWAATALALACDPSGRPVARR